MFRRGFAEGYQSGYDRYRGSNGGYGQPGYPGGTYRPDGGYGGSYGYPNGSYGYSGGYGRRRQRSEDSRTAIATAATTARDNDRYEPTRKKKYRDGDDGYNSRYGSRDQYRNEYRQSFQQGYDRGYREGRYR